AFVAYPGPSIVGDFRNFRAAATGFDIEVDQKLLDAISTEASASNYTIRRLSENIVDHGTAVPLYFFLKYGWSGRVVALGYSFLSSEAHLAFGECVRRATEKTGARTAFI